MLFSGLHGHRTLLQLFGRPIRVDWSTPDMSPVPEQEIHPDAYNFSNALHPRFTLAQIIGLPAPLYLPAFKVLP